MNRILTAAGHEVVQAFNAQVAIQLLAVMTPDVVLLDVILGSATDLNGWAVAGYMHTTPHLRTIPVIIISGLDAEAIREGARTYINTLANAALIFGKPVDKDALLQTLDRIAQSKT